MNKIRIPLILGLALFMFSACWQYPVDSGPIDDTPPGNQPTPTPPPPVAPDEIPLGFDYSTVDVLNLDVDVSFTDGSPYAGSVFELFLENVCGSANKDDKRVKRFRVNNEGRHLSVIAIPKGLETIYLCPRSGGLPASIPITVDRVREEARLVYTQANAPGNANIDHDEFTGDDVRFYNNYYPYKTGWSTLMYEDSWPRFDDYDMNDLVVDYRFTEIANKDNDIVEIIMDFRFRATCAGFSNAFAIELNVPSNRVSGVTYAQQGLFTGLVNQLPNGLEAGHPDRSVVIVTDNITEFIPQFINCVNGGPTLPPGALRITVSFNQPIRKADLRTAPYKPFLIPIPNESNFQLNRGMEIHLPNMRPTALANLSMLGTNDDDSSIADGRFYLSKDRRNWGMNVHQRMDVYPIPRVSIVEAFNNFVPWAKSGGQEKFDWYQNRPGYRNNENLFRGN